MLNNYQKSEHRKRKSKKEQDTEVERLMLNTPQFVMGMHPLALAAAERIAARKKESKRDACD